MQLQSENNNRKCSSKSLCQSIIVNFTFTSNYCLLRNVPSNFRVIFSIVYSNLHASFRNIEIC